MAVPLPLRAPRRNARLRAATRCNKPRMKRLATLALLGLLAPAGAQAQDRLSDVLVVERDGGRYLWLELDGQPTGLSYSNQGDRLTIQLTGFTPIGAREILPMGTAAQLDSIALMPSETGSYVIVQGRFAQPFAELREGGVWISLDAVITGDMPLNPGRVQVHNTYTAQTDHVSGHSEHASSPDAVGLEDQGSGEPGAHSSPPTYTIAPRAEALETSRVQDRSSRPTNTPSAAGERRGRTEPNRGGVADEGSQTPETPTEAVSEPNGGTAPISTVPPDERPAEVAAIAQAAAVQSNESAQPVTPCLETAFALRESPWDLAAMTLHADCLVAAEDRDGAAPLYERVLAFDPTHFRAAMRIRGSQGRGAEAARLFERAASAALTDGEALAARASAEANSDDDEDDEDEDGR